LERQAIDTALATVYALMTGDLAHPSGVVARDLNHWLERNKHLAQHITGASARPTRTIHGDVERLATSALAILMSCGAPLRSSGRRSSW
jgi:hypothetical protein